ncbi:unnamed protein product [Heligmosomoides polygyrus]|uniref:Transposase n=1 Tax=Heligmosomoides polygyrus TaxID=6339 RepID=A0A183F9M1_HELPZ|nr:unnamed protein product [Heligmosomoides polygyrus]
MHWLDYISVEFGRFRPEEVVYHRRDLIDFGEAPTMEEVIHRPKHIADRQINVCAVWWLLDCGPAQFLDFFQHLKCRKRSAVDLVEEVLARIEFFLN